MYDSGQVQALGQLKDGKPDGLVTGWHENGQKAAEQAYKDGKKDGLWAMWHENGQKGVERTFKDGEEVSAKYWNSKGEEVETEEEANE
jgi:antitoxin component YwqK of YwqJK toxin-antitoxin module